MTRWLDESEMRAWRNLAELMPLLQGELEGDLTAAQQLTMLEYQLLVLLSEAPSESLRMCDIAPKVHLTPSGLTRRVDGMVRDGLVSRAASEGDRRVIMVTLTPAGRARIERAAPDHLEHVRSRFVDHLTRKDIEALGGILERLRRSRGDVDTAFNAEVAEH